MAAAKATEHWRRRLVLPVYQISEAARYADISAQTVVSWHKGSGRKNAPLSEKERKTALSYMQLIEIAVVAAFRKARISLPAIRSARNYVATQLKSEFPFAEHRFKTEGKHLILDSQLIDGEKGKGKHIVADQFGQLGWNEIVGPLLREFEYEHDSIVVRWKVAGEESPVVIDPRIAFGVPAVRGTPTWILKARYDAGEYVSEIADDFSLKVAEVRDALKFEKIIPEATKKQWAH
jgi:uncharacterized protein (DUF433 family)